MVGNLDYGCTITAFHGMHCYRRFIGYSQLWMNHKGSTCRFATILHSFDFISARLGDPIDTTIGSHCSTHWSSPFGHLEGNSGSIAAVVSHIGRAYRTTTCCLILGNCGLGRSSVGFYHYDVTQGLSTTCVLYLYIIVLDTSCIGWRYKGRATTF